MIYWYYEPGRIYEEVRIFFTLDKELFREYCVEHRVHLSVLYSAEKENFFASIQEVLGIPAISFSAISKEGQHYLYLPQEDMILDFAKWIYTKKFEELG